MEKKTALSAAGALAMTSAAAVSALFLTVGQSSAGAAPAPTPAPEVVTEYEFVQIDELDAAAAVTAQAPEAATTLPPRTVYEIEYVQEEPAALTPATSEYGEDEYDEHEQEHEEDGHDEHEEDHG